MGGWRAPFFLLRLSLEGGHFEVSYQKKDVPHSVGASPPFFGPTLLFARVGSFQPNMFLHLLVCNHAQYGWCSARNEGMTPHKQSLMDSLPGNA